MHVSPSETHKHQRKSNFFLSLLPYILQFLPHQLLPHLGICVLHLVQKYHKQPYKHTKKILT